MKTLIFTLCLWLVCGLIGEVLIHEDNTLHARHLVLGPILMVRVFVNS